MRKKHNFRFCGIWFLIICLSLVWTGNLVLPSVRAAGKELLVDQAGLLTADEKAEVLAQLNRIRSRYGMDVVIVTADDLGGKDEQDYADDYYDENGYSRDGILLLVDMDDRLWWISTCGEGMDALPEEEIEDAAGEFLPDLSDGNYKEAFLGYVSVCEERIRTFLEDGGTDDGIYEDDADDADGAETKEAAGFSVGAHLLVSVGIGFVLALIVVLIMRSQLKTVHFKDEAGDYIKEGSMQLTEKQDWFLYSNVTRTPRPKPRDNSHDHFGGGGGGHVSSSGTTHGGGGGSF